jgi:hypothetical protein
VYRHGLPLQTVAQRRAALVGDTAAIIRASELVEKSWPAPTCWATRSWK